MVLNIIQNLVCIIRKSYKIYKGNKKLFFEFAEKMLSEKEFFIRKAIGWGLREMAKANPGEAFDFLMKVKHKASGLTLREGSKRLPEKMKKTITGK